VVTDPATTETLPVEAPAATGTTAGAGKAVVLLDDNVTCAPPPGAGPPSVTVTVAVAPLSTVVGLTERPLMAGPTVVKLNIDDHVPY
jgi:hypothetical protein